MKRVLCVFIGVVICGVFGYAGYHQWQTAIEVLNAPDLDQSLLDDEEEQLSLFTNLERKLLEVPLNGTVNLADIFPFEWDTVEIVNSPMGVDSFDWQEIYDYSEDDAFMLSSFETMSAFIFRKSGQIVDVVTINYGNASSSVFRPYLHDDLSDQAQYPRNQALFRADHIGSHGEKVFLPAE